MYAGCFHMLAELRVRTCEGILRRRTLSTLDLPFLSVLLAFEHVVSGFARFQQSTWAVGWLLGFHALTVFFCTEVGGLSITLNNYLSGKQRARHINTASSESLFCFARSP